MTNGRYVLGIIAIAVGVGLVLDLQGIWDFGDALSTYWPSILILIAVIQLITRSANPAFSVVLLTVGVIFQVIRLDLLPQGWGNYVWPAALILFGLVLLVARPWRPTARGKSPRRPPASKADDKVQASAFFGGIEHRIRSQDFRGGSATAFAGGVKLDLRDAKPAAEGADLDLTAVMGGIEVIVPAGWRIEVRGTPILGGIDNKTSPPAPGQKAPVLRVRGTAIMGGVEIKH